jgi:hypothetical protein
MTSTEELAVVEQLNKLETAKVAIRNAIIRKHVTVGASTPFEKYADAIDLIDSGIGGTYGKTKALFPLPPEGNFGGGINQKMAWKLGEVATLIKSEDDYPDTPTFIIDSNEAFLEWINFNANGQIEPPNDYTTILIKKKSDGKPYSLPHTIDFDQMKTERLFSENGVILEWDATIASNGATSNLLKSYHSRFAIQKSSLSISDRCYVQNLVIKCTSAKSKAIKNVYLIRGIEVQNNSTLSIGDLFSGYKILSRIFVETCAYETTTSETLTWTENNVSDSRTGAVIEVASGANILDVTIINKTPGKCCIAGFEGLSSGKLTRCYLLGAYNKGINVSNDQGSLVDRCFIQKVITVSPNTSAINAGAIINSFVNSHESNLAYNTTMDTNKNEYLSATFKAHTKIEGCKVNTIQGPRIVAFLATSDVINNAVINFIIDGTYLPTTPVKIIQGTRYITGNTIFKVVTKAGGLQSAFNFIGIEGAAGATIKDNIFGDILLDPGYGTGAYAFSAELIKSANLAEGNQINDFNVDFGILTSQSGGAVTIKAISAVSLIKNNFIRNISFVKQHYGAVNAIAAITILEGLSEISNNVIDTVTAQDNNYTIIKGISGAATVIKENRIGIIKGSNQGYNTSYGDYGYHHIEINGIYSEVPNVIITQNAIDTLTIYTKNGSSSPSYIRGIYASAVAEISKNLIGRIKTHGSPQYSGLSAYGIVSAGASGKIVENNLKLDIIFSHVTASSNTAAVETTIHSGVVYGISIANSNVEISQNTVDIVSTATSTYALFGVTTVPTSETKNQKNKLSVITLGESLAGGLTSNIYNLNNSEIIQDRLPNVSTYYVSSYSAKKVDTTATAAATGNNEIRGNEIDTTI